MKKRVPFKVPGQPERRCVGCHMDVRGGDYKALKGRRALCATCEAKVREHNARKAEEAIAEVAASGSHAREALMGAPAESRSPHDKALDRTGGVL